MQKKTKPRTKKPNKTNYNYVISVSFLFHCIIPASKQEIKILVSNTASHIIL